MNLQAILKAVDSVVDALVPMVEGGLSQAEQAIINDVKKLLDIAAQG